MFLTYMRARVRAYIWGKICHICHTLKQVVDIKTKTAWDLKQFLCSATGNRTPVYGVRGRCPRPLDDSTVTLCHTSFLKASAKVLLFFDMTKYFRKKNAKKCDFSGFLVFFNYFFGQRRLLFLFFWKHVATKYWNSIGVEIQDFKEAIDAIILGETEGEWRNLWFCLRMC